MSRVVYGVVLSILCIQSVAQTPISGVIVDKVDGSPIIGATVTIQETQQATVSGIDGKFAFNAIPQNDYSILVRSVGYISDEISISQFSDKIKIELEEKIFDLPDVVVESITLTGGVAGACKSLGSAHYIGQKEIQKFSYTDINRTLRKIPGVNIQEEDGYGLRPNIGLRATGSERSSKITVMEDGVLAAPAPYAAPAAYYFPTVGRMEAIEILKGSSQIKYGPYTTGGAINLISTPLPTTFSGHADFIVGSNNYKMLHANLGNAHKNVSYLVETMQYSADGFKLLDNGANTGFNKEDYLAKVRVHTSADAKIYQSLTFKIGQAKEVSNETYLGLTDEDFTLTPLRRYAGSQEDIMTTSHSQYSLTHFAELASFLDIHTTAYRTEFSRNWYKLDKVNGKSISSILADPITNGEAIAFIKGAVDTDEGLAVKANNRSYNAQGVQTNLIIHFNQGHLKHKIDVGLRLHRDQIDRFQWVDNYGIINGQMILSQAGDPGTESNRVETANAFSGYIQHKLELARLTLTTGLRHERISMERLDYGKQDTERSGSFLKTRENEVNIFIPGIAASYVLTKGSSIFGGVHRGFAPPGSKEGTLPEKSWNYELGLRYSNDGLRAQVLSFYNNYSNLLGSDLAATGGTGSQDLFNGGSAIARGIEAELSYDIVRSRDQGYKLPVSLAYTYSDAYFNNSFESDFDAWESVVIGDRLPYVPRHQLAVSLSLEHDEALNPSRTDEAFTIDIAVNYKLSKELSAFVNVNNALNIIYVVSRRPAGVRPNLPRTYNVGLKANF